MLAPDRSLRIDSLRFPLIVGVVFIHVDTAVQLAGQGAGSGGFPAELIVRQVVSQNIARTAVPLFFLFAGYLFAFEFDWSFEGLRRKWRSRAKTLLVPFVFWNLLTLALYAAVQSIPALAPLMSGRNAPIASYSAFDYLDAVFGIRRLPIAYQFWFIRDLMILVLLAPLIHRLTRRVPLLLLGVLAAAWIARFWPIPMPTAEATLFYALGIVLGSRGANLFALDGQAGYWIAAYIAFIAADCVFAGSPGWASAHQAGIALGVVAVLCATRGVTRSAALLGSLRRLSVASFFVYAAHEPMLTITKKLVAKLHPPGSAPVAILEYLLVPVFVVVVLLLAYHALARLLPRTTALATGGRGG